MLLSLYSLAYTIALMLQSGPGPGFPGLPNGGDAVQAVPVDGGLTLLAVAGGAYAIRRLRDRASR